MNDNDRFLCAAVNSNLQNTVPEDPGFSEKEWIETIVKADEHKLLPLVYDVSRKCRSFSALPKEQSAKYQKSALKQVSNLVIRNNEFLTLLLQLQASGMDPVVVKGVICQSLYPMPLLRISVDDDLFVPGDQMAAYHRFFLEHGLTPDDPETDIAAADEISYHKEGSSLYIELHRSLFPENSDAYGNLNRFFEKSFADTVHVQIQDVAVRTLSPTDHLLYLVLHAFKHFLHSGIGIRAVCDIGLFADRWHAEINWAYLRDCLASANAFDYTRALFKIIDSCLLDRPSYMQEITEWDIASIDEESLLQDIMDSGIHGASSVSRLHSSNITLYAVKNGEGGNGALHSVFLPVKEMEGRYPYLRKAPFLLPFAWIQRIAGYLTEKRSASDTPQESIRLGQNRVKLLKKYHIIPEKK